jgi:hypothetical protein
MKNYRIRSAWLCTLILGVLFLPISSFGEGTELRREHYERTFSRDRLLYNKAQRQSALMQNHGGPVLRSSTTMAIYWGTQWNTPSFAGDKIQGLDRFFSGINGSSYAATATEYSDSTGFITANSLYLGHVVDATAAPSRALTTAGAVAEGCKVVNNNPDPNALYLIYTATGAGKVNYCAWHSWGNCPNGSRIQVAYMPNLDGIAGCDPQDTTTGNSQGLAALANVTAHELLETITDPRGTAWYDSSGSENGDKCAWSFPVSAGNPAGLSTLTNGSMWKLQMEWSNAAYTASTGFPNTAGQKGCIF